METHLSWVVLTGEDAYKIKKPVHYDFVDFSTLERRHHYCLEELRLNRAFAPDIYLGVVPILRRPDGRLEIAATLADERRDDVEDWAVHMRQFDESAEALHLLERNALDSGTLAEFGRMLAVQHDGLDRITREVDQTLAITANFDTLAGLAKARRWRAEIETLADRARADLAANAAIMATRQRDGFIRECHGDLHLGNMILTAAGLRAFDCLEFDPDLRAIDLWSDSAFLAMDLAVRARTDLAYAFLDGYLGESGDYAGACLLPMYARYRSVVRAKVAALATGSNEARGRLRDHIVWALAHQQRGTGTLTVTCGLSGSGKSHWGARLVPELPALRLRSDVLRKRLAGLEPGAHSDSTVGAGLYTRDRSAALYRRLADNARDLLERGENVLVDAACLRAAERATLRDAAARTGAACRFIHFTAPRRVLAERIEARARRGNDPSEADLAVLEWQERAIEPPGPGEALTVDTQDLTLDRLLRELLQVSPGDQAPFDRNAENPLPAPEPPG